MKLYFKFCGFATLIVLSLWIILVCSTLVTADSKQELVEDMKNLFIGLVLDVWFIWTWPITVPIVFIYRVYKLPKGGE